jgi:hypothetical protein
MGRGGCTTLASSGTVHAISRLAVACHEGLCQKLWLSMIRNDKNSSGCYCSGYEGWTSTAVALGNSSSACLYTSGQEGREGLHQHEHGLDLTSGPRLSL